MQFWVQDLNHYYWVQSVPERTKLSSKAYHPAGQSENQEGVGLFIGFTNIIIEAIYHCCAHPETRKEDGRTRKTRGSERSGICSDVLPKMSGIFVVIGARRGLGLEVVRRLLELPMNQVKEVRAVCRPSNAITTELKDPSDVRIKLVQIDGCNAEALRESQVLAGAECVFFCASASSTLKNYKDVDQEGPKVVAAAALEAKVPKMVRSFPLASNIIALSLQTCC